MKKKHAYMIIAHNKFDILEKLIKLLDDERNDIYIHVDKKVKDFNFNKFKSIPQNSIVYFVPRISVNWGGYSQVKCELILLKEATKQKYEYYHLISGVDLPLKSQDEIHNYFDKNKGIEFIHYVNHDIKKFLVRVSRYHLLQDYKDISKNRYNKLFIRIINKGLLEIQRIVRINRLNNVSFSIQFGSQWFSITDDLARFVISKEPWIKKFFSFSLCPDELFLQTLVYSSEFKDKVSNIGLKGSYYNCLRKIDWTRGKPYIWRIEDVDELLSSNYLFARKFDSEIDNQVINKIFSKIHNI